ncbi:MAG: class I SAM-dependent methyltransferase [Cyclobacteriaceae bacterium]|nr:class I SAM-dependent methyltransferase [Cyclobacteriaceae bacterium]MCX7636425.1 class I SAM-dependent methyltransferase [Cyclobacteriaceae bacterium]MDW8330744.1 class I SAM-dependent methyltransferase [Cyclobacteriaceae bacterium]
MEFSLICPACGNSFFSDYLSTRDFALTNQEFQLKICETCGTLATTPQPDEVSINRYYQFDHYISHTNQSKNKLISAIYKTVRTYALKQKRKVIEKRCSSTPKSILDIGCGTGLFLNEMKNAGWQIAGIEPALIARKQAEKLLNSTIYSAVDELAKKTFSVITFWHVLEHLHQPDKTLTYCYQLLRPGGLLVVALPNYLSYDAAHYKSLWAAYDVPRHLWHFNRGGMQILLSRLGYSLKEVRPMTFDSFYVSLLSEQYRDGQPCSTKKYARALITGLKSNLKAARNGQYSSLLYIAEKKYEMV